MGTDFPSRVADLRFLSYSAHLGVSAALCFLPLLGSSLFDKLLSFWNELPLIASLRVVGSGFLT